MARRFIGSKEPRTREAIAKVRCASCRARPAVHQWSGCANGNRHVPLCLKCDQAINEIFLAFMRHPNRVRLMAAYRRRKA